MRVLEVAAAGALDGGGEKHVADLLRRLPSSGVELALAVPAGGGLDEMARSLGVLVFHVPISRGFSVRALRQLRETVGRLAPDVLHAHGSRAAAFARAADPRARERVVYTLHGIHADQAGSPARRPAVLGIERLLRPRTARFIAVSRANAEKGARLRVLDPLRTTIITNGIEFPPPAADRGVFRSEIGIGDGVPLVLSIGRLEEPKDQVTLLRAWSHASRAHPDAVLALVGSGKLESVLRAVASSEGLGDRVRFVRPRADLAPVYVDADVFALSSRWEGLPYVVLEAMAYGLPVVATGVDGIPEAVTAGETGLLVRAGCHRSLGDAIATLLAAPQERARMGDAGRLRVRTHFTIDRMIEQVSDLYRQVASA